MTRVAHGAEGSQPQPAGSRGVADGIRTLQTTGTYNPGLYQLSYRHPRARTG